VASESQRRNVHRPLFPAFDKQNQIFSRAFSVLQEAISQRAFPAASIAVTLNSELRALKSFGTFVYENNPGNIESAESAPLLASFARSGSFDDARSDVLSPATLFDVASLTKPVATTAMAAILYERGLLELDAPIIGTIPEFGSPSDPRRAEITSRMLLTHSSGLPAYEKLFLKAHSPDELLQSALQTPLTADPATRAEYSDIGFMILGLALERLSQESLDVFCQREIFGPLGMSNTTFKPSKAIQTQIPPTADEREQAGLASGPHSRSTFRNRIIQGEVQDENASLLGGVAGHAGLFSTAHDLAIFASTMLQGGTPILRPETVALFSRRQSAPAGTSRALGWDTPSSPSQSGKYFGPHSYGHLGYTGTSLWIDPDRQISITLLTNRTWPDCSNQAIKQVRPKFHDAIIEALIYL
jgi:serine-type D-Ala-D-Ala carboxypeptidase